MKCEVTLCSNVVNRMKKKTGGAHGKWKETFHIWNPRIKIGRKGQGCWQQNLLITTGSQRPHTYGTKLQQYREKRKKPQHLLLVLSCEDPTCERASDALRSVDTSWNTAPTMQQHSVVSIQQQHSYNCNCNSAFCNWSYTKVTCLSIVYKVRKVI